MQGLYEKEFEPLVGKRIVALFGDKEELYFQTEDEIYHYGCEGDCCSTSWFEHLSGLSELIGHTVTSYREIPMSEVEDPDRDVVRAYGFEILTDKGRFFIEMRNESNGYYGGNLTYGGVIDRTDAPQILEDF